MNHSIRHIENFFSVNNRMPTFEEVQKLYGYKSKSATSYFIDKLIEANILGKKKGDKVTVHAPKGEVEYTIVATV